jgi:hypothetical protein
MGRGAIDEPGTNNVAIAVFVELLHVVLENTMVLKIVLLE